MQALVNTANAAQRLAFRDVPEPEPADGEAVVAVRAFSVNRGELALMRARPDGWRPGQDVAGVVVRPARDGTGPREGERVAALVDGAGWAERVAVPVSRLARVPDGVPDTAAAALPMAGLTALALLRRCGAVVGRSLCVTGASGGVGSMLVQLGSLAGARIAAVARPEHEAWLQGLGAASVIPAVADAADRFDVVLESVGGPSLEQAVARVRPGGRVVVFGSSSGAKAALDFPSFRGAENASLETFFSYLVFYGTIDRDLGYLLDLLARGRLEVRTTVHGWHAVDAALAELEGRGTPGKVVLNTTALGA